MLAAAPPGKIFNSADVRSAFPSLPELATPAQIDAAAKTAPAQSSPSLDGPPSEAFLRAFLPAPLRRQDRLHGEWLAEFRWVAMVAVSMTDLRCNDESGLALTQSVATMLQDCAELFDGAITSFTMSDKGPMAIIAFGLPGQAHDDDAARAVRLAHKAQAALASERVAGRAAVTFGLAYCGVVGNRERKDYAIIGDAINRAAKLVSRKDAPSLVCDQAIAEKAGPWIAFEPLSEPQEREAPLFRPVLGSKAPARRLASFHGRETEMSWLQGRLDEVGSAARGSRPLHRGRGWHRQVDARGRACRPCEGPFRFSLGPRRYFRERRRAVRRLEADFRGDFPARGRSRCAAGRRAGGARATGPAARTRGLRVRRPPLAARPGARRSAAGRRRTPHLRDACRSSSRRRRRTASGPCSRRRALDGYGILDAGRASGAGHRRRAPDPPRPTRPRRGVAGHGKAGAHGRRPLAIGAAVANRRSTG